MIGHGGLVSARTTQRAALAVGAFAVTLTLANAVLLWIGRTTMNTAEDDLFFGVISVIGSVLYVAIGLLITVRARSVIGWFLAGVGITFGLLTFGNAYGAVGLVTSAGSLPAAEEVSTALSQVWMFGLVGIALLLLLFPDGRPPSARWRPVVWIAVGSVVASYVLFLLKPMAVAPIQSTGSFPNPFAIHVAFVGPALVATSWATVLAAVACFAGLVQRFRHGGAELRQQIKWLGLLAAIGAGCVFVAIAGLVGCGCDESPIAVVAFFVLILIVLFGVPTSIAVALFKYRLYDLDLVVNKALVYGLLAAVFTLVYVAFVVGVGTVVGGRGNPFLTMLAAVAIALGFQPVRQRVTHLANRLVYGRRATPYEVLSEFADRVATRYAAEDVLPRMAAILANGTGATSARVWLRFDDEIRTAASWPENGADTSVEVAEDHPRHFGQGETGAEVRHQGELLGALTVTMPSNDPINPAKERLVRDLAAQAGLVLRNARLIEELRASRRRIVTAQDDRAKQLERNIHDGAQQELVALGVQLGLAHRIAERSAPDMAQTLDRLREQATDALENLRDLARGIYPPLLADQGLLAALEAQARKAAIPVQVEAAGIGRYPQEAEAAVYFCCLEALQNVAKYANASAAGVRLWERDGMLRFTVSDDGDGFDTARTGLGSGLQGMKDRLEALGGSFEISSRPGEGTVVDGAIPLASLHSALA
jgi:signal transduction histidine kinase